MMRSVVWMVMLCLLSGCANRGAVSIPLQEADDLQLLQGRWQFDEQKFLHAMENAIKKDFELYKQTYDQSKQVGMPFMSDIQVQGASIVTEGGKLQQQFDLIDYTVSNQTVKGKAVWHSDRYDPGDSTTIDVALTVQGDELTFLLDPRPTGVPFFFRRRND